MMIAIQETMKGWRTRQAVSAKRLGLTLPGLNDLLRGRIEISIDALPNHAILACISVKLEVERHAA
jgi:predicted XRE-type DNA-binding protein